MDNCKKNFLRIKPVPIKDKCKILRCGSALDRKTRGEHSKFKEWMDQYWTNLLNESVYKTERVIATKFLSNLRYCLEVGTYRCIPYWFLTSPAVHHPGCRLQWAGCGWVRVGGLLDEQPVRRLLPLHLLPARPGQVRRRYSRYVGTNPAAFGIRIRMF